MYVMRHEDAWRAVSYYGLIHRFPQNTSPAYALWMQQLVAPRNNICGIQSYLSHIKYFSVIDFLTIKYLTFWSKRYICNCIIA